MTDLVEVEGDLFTGGTDAIAHGCNLQGVMGAGVAKVMRQKFPEMYQWYRISCGLGEFELGDAWAWSNWNPDVVVFNLMTQDKPGADATLAAVRDAVYEMVYEAEDMGVETIGLPRIGCGIGGLLWDDVRKILVGAQRNTDVLLKVFVL